MIPLLLGLACSLYPLTEDRWSLAALPVGEGEILTQLPGSLVLRYPDQSLEPLGEDWLAALRRQGMRCPDLQVLGSSSRSALCQTLDGEHRRLTLRREAPWVLLSLSMSHPPRPRSPEAESPG